MIDNPTTENKLDYLLRHDMSTEELGRFLADGLTMDEVYQSVRNHEENNLDWRTGRPKGEGASNNHGAVYSLIDKMEKKIDGERKQVVCNTAQNFLVILRNDERFQNVKFNTLRGLRYRSCQIGRAHV